MDKEQYLRELEGRLSNRMQPQELERILRYYREYFGEAGPDRTADVMQELGSPAELTRRVMGEQVIRDMEVRAPAGENERPQKRGLGAVWTVILAICAAPIAIPVVVALVAAALALLVAIFAVFVGLGAAGVACIVMGVFSAVAGFTLIRSGGLATTMYFVGGGMLTAGVGFALLAAGFALTGTCLRGLARLLGRMLHRREALV